MTEHTARQVANVVIGAGAVGAAVLVLKTPSLRRLAVGLAVTALTTSLPLWLRNEVQQAWSESARRSA